MRCVDDVGPHSDLSCVLSLAASRAPALAGRLSNHFGTPPAGPCRANRRLPRILMRFNFVRRRRHSQCTVPTPAPPLIAQPPGQLGTILLCACGCIDTASSALTGLRPVFESDSRVLCYPVPASAMLALSVGFLSLENAGDPTETDLPIPWNAELLPQPNVDVGGPVPVGWVATSGILNAWRLWQPFSLFGTGFDDVFWCRAVHVCSPTSSPLHLGPLLAPS
ncbi:hypothetical protein C8Q79DRAFT_311834 [Trametes meyenii]|nr:hypothetical protein C8Q79DRAFT_311834 [Trametes meyenii]